MAIGTLNPHDVSARVTSSVVDVTGEVPVQVSIVSGDSRV
jgi:hypothetical protein